MGKRLSQVDTFFIEHHKEKMSAEEIAKQIGCSSRTVYNYLNRKKGDQRTEEGRLAAKGEPPPPPPNPDEPQPNPEMKQPVTATSKIPVPFDQFLGVRKHGNSGAVVMTKEASEWGDDMMKTGQQNIPPHVHVINPEK